MRNPTGIDLMALAADADEQLIRTPGGSKLHIEGCSHLTATSDARPASDEDARLLELCVECAAELNGQGRTPFDSLDAAMEEYGVPVDARAKVRELVAPVGADRIWIPYSRSYIAMGKGTTRALYIGKTYVWIDGERTTWPEYSPGGGGSSSRERDDVICPTCGLALPLTGVCDDC